MSSQTDKKNLIERKWHLFDAEGKILGKIAVEAAILLRGKNKPNFMPNNDQGDFVVVINAAKIKMTGRKVEQKTYYHYSGYPGGISEKNFQKTIQKNPAWVFRKAVYGMLPVNKLRNIFLKRFKVFAGSDHPYAEKFSSSSSI